MVRLQIGHALKPLRVFRSPNGMLMEFDLGEP
jgi:hypothetical protein